MSIGDSAKRNAARRLRHEVNRINARVGGDQIITTRSPSGHRNGVVIASRPTKLQYSAASQIGFYVRQKMRPIRIPPITVYDAAGTPIATITINPVTGARQRMPILPPHGGT